MINKTVFLILCWIVRAILFFYHPVFIVKGRENVPKEGRVIICPNHCGLMDPAWVIIGLKLGRMPAVISKKELMKVPVLSSILRYLKVIPVERDGTDINALKTSMKRLKEGHALLLFPEGTRVKPGMQIEAKGGAMLMAARTESAVLPVYVSVKRFPFSPIRCIIGEMYTPPFASSKPTEEEINENTKDMMKRIYALGENV